MSLHIGVTVLLAVALATAGCVGTQPGSTAGTEFPTETATPTDTVTPPPSGTVELPSGPKGPPERPPVLTRSTVREYVRTYEYRYAYNALWMSEHTDVELDCQVDEVSKTSWGFAVVVTCTGHSNTNPPDTATATPGVHADWFTQTFRYLVSEDATRRVRPVTPSP